MGYSKPNQIAAPLTAPNVDLPSGSSDTSSPSPVTLSLAGFISFSVSPAKSPFFSLRVVSIKAKFVSCQSLYHDLPSKMILLTNVFGANALANNGMVWLGISN